MARYLLTQDKKDKIMEKEVKNLKSGDVFEKDGVLATFTHKVMRGNGKYDVYAFEHPFSPIKLYPTDKVTVFGKTNNVLLWEDDERESHTRKMWEELREYIKEEFVQELEKLYYADLFGKRGKYSEVRKLRFVDNYQDVKNLKSIVDNEEIKSVESDTYENIDTTYSRLYETECYGNRELFVYVETNKSKYQLSCGKITKSNK